MAATAEIAATAEGWQQRRRDCSYGGEMAAAAERLQLRRRDGSNGGEMAATVGWLKIGAAAQSRGTSPSVLGEKARIKKDELISKVI